MRRRDLMAGVAASVLTGRGALAQNIATDPIFQFVKPSPITLNLLGPLDSRWTFARASQGTQVQSGVLNYAPNNLFTYSQDFSNAIWTTNAATTKTAAYAVAPDGTTTAARVQLVSAGNQNVTWFQQNVSGAGLGASATNTVSFWFKSNTGGSQTFAIKSTQAGVADHFSGDLTATTTWQRLSYSVAFGAGGSGYYAGVSVGSALAAADILVWGAQLEQNTTMGAYNPTTTAAYYGPRFETSPAGSLNQPQATNFILQSKTLTTAPWILQGAFNFSNVTGPDGAMSGWQGAVGGGGQGFYQYITGLTASTRYEPSIWILPITTTGTVEITNPWSALLGDWRVNLALLSAGWNYVTRSSSAVTIISEFTSDATGRSGIYVYTFDGTLRTAAFSSAQIELGTFSTSAIATTTAAATRAADNLTLDLTQFPGLQRTGGYSCAIEFSLLSNNNQSQVVFGMSGAGGFSNTWYFSDDGAGGLRVTTIVATVNQTSASATLRTVSLTNRLALTVTPTGITFNLNGAGDVTVTNAGMPTMTTLAVLRAPWNASNYEAGHATLVTLVPGPQSAAWRASRSY